MATESHANERGATSESPAQNNGPKKLDRDSRRIEKTQHHPLTSDWAARARVQKFSRGESTYSYSCPGIWSGAAMELR